MPPDPPRKVCFAPCLFHTHLFNKKSPPSSKKKTLYEILFPIGRFMDSIIISAVCQGALPCLMRLKMNEPCAQTKASNLGLPHPDGCEIKIWARKAWVRIQQRQTTSSQHIQGLPIIL